MSTIIANRKLEQMGFKKIQPTTHEDEFSYDWLRFKKGDSNLEVTTEYDLNGKAAKQYFDFNGETLKGNPVRPFEIRFLQELM